MARLSGKVAALWASHAIGWNGSGLSARFGLPVGLVALPNASKFHPPPGNAERQMKQIRAAPLASARRADGAYRRRDARTSPAD
jgi:hypothetical protein